MASKGAVKNIAIKLQASTARTVFTYWTWKEPHTDHYRVVWSYSTGQYSAARGDVIWFVDSDSTVTTTTSTYNAPSNATQVRVRVLPVAATKGEDDKNPYWTASWTRYINYKFSKTIGRKIPQATHKVKNFTVTKETGTDRTIRASWGWEEPNTAGYKVDVDYQTSDGTWYNAEDSEVDGASHRYYAYNAPANAFKVRYRIEPIPDTYVDGDYETPWWSTTWTEFKSYSFEKTEAEKEAERTDRLNSKPTSISFGIQNGTQRTVYVTWNWTKENTDHYEVAWEYTTGQGVWFSGQTDTSITKKNALYSAPDNALKIRCRIRAISKERKSNNVSYWTAQWSDWKTYTIPKAAPDSSPNTDSLKSVPYGITFNTQSGTKRTVYVTWKWSKENTDHYEVQWQYTTGQGVWFAGQTDTSITLHNALYSPPDNALKIRCRIKAISKQRSSDSSYYWTSNWSEWKVYTVGAGGGDSVSPDPSPDICNVLVTNLVLKNQKGSGSKPTVLATWNWDKSNTDHFEYEWDYTNGDTVINPKTKKKQYVWVGLTSGSTPDVSHKNATYNGYDDNAIYVRFRVKGVSKTHNVVQNGQTYNIEYWTASYNSWTTYAINRKVSPSALSTDNLTSVPKNLTLKKQGGTDRSIYATWTWSVKNTDHYDYEFEYRAGGVWFSGNEGSTTDDTKQSPVYSVPDNATAARFRVRPISKSRKGQDDKDYDYYLAKYSSWVYWYCESPTVSVKKVTVRNVEIDYQDDQHKTLYAEWTWNGTLSGYYESDGKTLRDLTKEYRVIWRYKTTESGPWFDGSDSTVTRKLSTYSVPDNAIRVYVKIKPISKTRSVYGKDVLYWTANFCDAVTFNVAASESHEPAEASVPTVTIDNLKLRAELSTYDSNTKLVEFEVIKVPTTGNSSRHKLLRVKVDRNLAIATTSVNAGCFYKVHARGIYPTNNSAIDTLLSNTTSSKNAVFGSWSQYSEIIGTRPAAPKEITKHSVESSESMTIYWTKSDTATGYEIQYTTNKKYFDVSDEVTSITQDNTETHRVISGLEAGKYFFRVRATNEAGESGWTPIYPAVLGTAPSAPTTWSETTTALLTESVNLYWMHNSEDGSSQTKAQVRITVNGETTTVSPTKLSTDDTSSYYTCRPVKYTKDNLLDSNNDVLLDSNESVLYSEMTANFQEGAIVTWQVRTQGVLASWSPWSAQRTVVFYAPPTISLNIENDPESDYKMQTVRSYPIYVRASAEPLTQKVIGYSITILAGESYTTTGDDGTEKFVNNGEIIYSKYINSTKGSENTLVHKITAGDIALEDGVSYILNVTASMDSGLTADDTYLFYVNWDDTELVPNAEVQFDSDLYCAYIHPYCVDDDGGLIDNVSLSVYRREYDGTFTLIADDIDNGDATSVTDPHPALDYARYRIVAMSSNTGRIGYYDCPSVPVGVTSIIIQWDDAWSNYNTEDDDSAETNTWTNDPVWKGSLVKFPYNIGVSANYGMDVSLVEYIGRKHPVSYYGTQLGESASWTADIPRNDFETLYQLRRLAIYPGDCYVREPSGSGYWAQVTPSFNRNYDSMVIPVTLDITRVEGGM